MTPNSVKTTGQIRFGEDLELDVRSYELRRAGRILKLERIPTEVLLLLVERQGDLVTREQIIERVWGKDTFLDTDNSINAAIRKVRQVLKDDPEQPRFVQTITGRGYRFIAPITKAGLPPTIDPDERAHLRLENLIGKKVSHYRVLQILGGGGMGVVYKAEDLKLGRKVAIKFLPAEMVSKPEAFARLEREARAASALEHSNICPIYELGEHGGQPFIVMQLLEGQTLQERIEISAQQKEPLAAKEIRDIGLQIAAGLGAAHEKGIIHRDIKPANIFLTQRGEAKILDFGLAKINGTDPPTQETGEQPAAIETLATSSASSLSSSSLTTTKMGTASYMSPEQVRGEEIDARSDLFSFGLVLYEMATAQRAFSGDTVAVVQDAILQRDTLPTRQLNPQLPGELEKIINKAVRKHREQRYQSARAMQGDLERLRLGLTPSAGRQRAKLGWVLASLALAMFAAVSMVVGFRGRIFKVAPAPETTAIKARPSVAVLGFKNLSGKTEEAWISTALAETLRAELSSGQQLRVIPGEDVARMQLDLSLPASDGYSLDTLNKIRQDLSTDVVVLGSYLAVGKDSGGKVRLNLQMQDAKSGETVTVISQDGTEAEIAEMVSRSGAELRRKLGIDAVSDRDAVAVQASIPANLAAARFYAEGLTKLQTYDALAARDLLQEAVAADPDYALAHSALAESWDTLGYIAKAQQEASKAFALSANRPREERLSIEGRYRELTNDFPAAIEIYRTLRNFFPDVLDYGLRLAAAQSHSGAARDAQQTIARMRSSPEPESRDVRIDLAEAKAAENLGDFKLMQQAGHTAAAKAQAQGRRLMIAQAKEQEGWAWEHLGEMEKAKAAYAQAQDLSAAAGNPNLTATVLYGIAQIFFDEGEYDSARKNCEESERIYRQVGSMQNAAFATSCIGNIVFAAGKLEEAKRYYERALKVHQNLGDRKALGQDLGNIANTLSGLGDLMEATRLQGLSLQAYREVGNRLGEATTLNSLGSLLLDRGQLGSARQTLEQAMTVEQQSGQEIIRGYVWFNLADILIAEDRLKDAHATAERALALRKQHNERNLVSASQLQLAKIALEQGEPAEAESLIRVAKEGFGKQPMPDDGCNAESLLARVLMTQGKIKEAQISVQRAIDFSKQLSDRTVGFTVATEAASVDAASGRMSEAARTLENVRAEAARYGYVGYELEARLRLGELELRSEKLAEGKDRLAKLQTDAEQKGFLLIAHKASPPRSH